MEGNPPYEDFLYDPDLLHLAFMVSNRFGAPDPDLVAETVQRCISKWNIRAKNDEDKDGHEEVHEAKVAALVLSYLFPAGTHGKSEPHRKILNPDAFSRLAEHFESTHQFFRAGSLLKPKVSVLEHNLLQAKARQMATIVTDLTWERVKELVLTVHDQDARQFCKYKDGYEKSTAMGTRNFEFCIFIDQWHNRTQATQPLSKLLMTQQFLSNTIKKIFIECFQCNFR